MYNQKKCILIVDDEIKMIIGLRDYLTNKNYYILVANNGSEALDIFYKKNNIIDIILLDVMMPILDGFEVLKTLRCDKQNVPIILLTARDQEYDQLEGFKLGADDYISKPFSLPIMLARVESVLNRTGKTSKEELSVGELKININNKYININNEKVQLTSKEYELLYYLVINKNIILSREQILNNVWGYEYEGDIRTVDTHIKQIRIKLKDKANYIKTIHKTGYLFEVDK